MPDAVGLKKQILQRLSDVLDPETGIDVVRMHLLEDIKVLEDGTVLYIFRPSSYSCPFAVSLGIEILNAISEVDGVVDQKVTVVDYIQADTLNNLLNSGLSKYS